MLFRKVMVFLFSFCFNAICPLFDFLGATKFQFLRVEELLSKELRVFWIIKEYLLTLTFICIYMVTRHASVSYIITFQCLQKSMQCIIL